MSWWTKFLPTKIRTEGGTKKAVPEGLWAKCDACSGVLYRADLERNLLVCPKCDHHMRVGARMRLEHFLDAEPRIEIGANLEPVDALDSKIRRNTNTLSILRDFSMRYPARNSSAAPVPRPGRIVSYR